MDFQVVVLAGGTSKNLIPLVSKEVPKALLPVANRPVLSYVLEHLEQSNLKDLIVVVEGQEAAALVGNWISGAYVDRLHVEVAAVPEDVGTAGSLRAIAHHLTAKDIMVVSGDLVSDVPPGAVAAAHRRHDAVVTAMLSSAPVSGPSESGSSTGKDKTKKPGRYNIIGLDPTRQFLLYIATGAEVEKDIRIQKSILRAVGQMEIRADLMDAHLYAFKRSVLQEVLDQKDTFHSLKQDVLPYLVRSQLKSEVLLKKQNQLPMETASCSILNSLCFSNKNNNNIINSRRYCCLYAPRRNPYLVLPFSSVFPRTRRRDFFSSPGKCLHFNHSIAFCSLSSSDNPNPSQELAVLLEVEGVLMDAYRVGNRQAFNVAFRKLGLDCANWSEPVYLDLVRKCSGDEERMLNLYFNRIGWPTSLPTNERGPFIKSVLREKKNALDEFVMSKSSPLRPGVESFIDDAYHEGIPLVIVTAYSKSGDKIARSIIEKLGHERISKVKIVGNEEVKRSFYGQLVTNKGLSSGSDEQIAKEAIKAVSAEKQKIAEDVASMLKLSVEIDTGSSESLGKTVAALRAGAEYAGVPFQNCVLIAGNQTGVAGAERIGMPCIVLRSSLTSRAEFHSAKAIMDGFGGADLTISKLCQKKWS